jgi:hypothetical protein
MEESAVFASCHVQVMYRLMLTIRLEELCS